MSSRTSPICSLQLVFLIVPYIHTSRRLPHQYIVKVLPTFTPKLHLTWAKDSVLLTEIPSTGTVLKALEDQLDSLICAYVAAYWWYWGEEKNIVLGDLALMATLSYQKESVLEQGSRGRFN